MYLRSVCSLSVKKKIYHTTCESTCDTQSSSAANQGDNIVSVPQGGTATPSATKQLLPPDRAFKIYISIYTPDQLKQTLHWTFVHLHFSAVSELKMRLLSAVGVIATISWFCVITWEWWLHVHCIHVEMPSISVIYSVRFPSVQSFFFCVTARKHSRQTLYIILLKDVICWSMGPSRWVVSKKESSWSKFVQVALWLPLSH